MGQEDAVSSISMWAQEFSALGPMLESVAAQDHSTSSELVCCYRHLVQSLKETRERNKAIFAADTVLDASRYFTLSDLILFALDELGFLSEDQELVKPLLVASVLGELPHRLAYHNTEHFRKVLHHAIRLVFADINFAREKGHSLPKEQIVLLMIAACIHDIGHDGTSNVQSGQYDPGRLELRSFGMAEPYLAAAGLSEGALSYLRTMILCTDASRPDNPSCPLSQLKAAYQHHFSEPGGKPEHSAGQVFAFLRNRKDLTLLSMYLHEADIMSSAGVSYERTRCETIQFKLERGEGQARPSDVLEFFDTICRGGFLTPAGKALAQKPYESIRAAVELDFQNGNAVYHNQESC